MICTACGDNFWGNTFRYLEPDKYEKLVGLTKIRRFWNRCLYCGMYQHFRDYPLKELEKIYEHGYRHPDFRGETINEAFDRIVAIKDSENEVRVKWLTDIIGVPESMLDIGSGIGVFPYKMQELGSMVRCTEENFDSLKFLPTIGLHCAKEIPDHAEFDLVSIVHVLEHIENPVEFLKDLHKSIQTNGRLFIEVPDAEAFNWLDKDHDDFNSCHVCSYNVSTLYQVLKKAGFDVTDIHRVFYPERKLSRIMGIWKKT